MPTMVVIIDPLKHCLDLISEGQPLCEQRLNPLTPNEYSVVLLLLSMVQHAMASRQTGDLMA